jgi:tetratricopeptide (TPR) repeat protein
LRKVATSLGLIGFFMDRLREYSERIDTTVRTGTDPGEAPRRQQRRRDPLSAQTGERQAPRRRLTTRPVPLPWGRRHMRDGTSRERPMRLATTERLVGLLLAVLTLVVFLPAVGHDFVCFDDGVYVSENPQVLAGLTSPSLRWAFSTLHAGYYQPMTWLSLQGDAQLFGVQPWGFHLGNVLWHAANVVLVFAVFRRLTGAAGRSAAVAGLFAVHPLHVESVAWVTERKDVLSLFFALLAIAAYAAWTERGGAGRYLAVLASFALSLLAKPMLVTLPFVLLLLDFWPLRRFENADGRMEGDRKSAICNLQSAILEKLPLFALALGMAALTIQAHKQVGGLVPLERLPLGVRLANAVVACAWYLGKTFWPVGLAPFYPYPIQGLSAWQVALCALLLVVISALALASLRRRPYLAVGWLWFLGALVPVLGLVQAGDQAVADRFTYFPHLGLFLMVVWGLADVPLPRALAPGALRAGVTVAACFALAACTWRQVGYWRDSVTVLQHALRVSEDNPMAHDALGNALARQGRLEAACGHFAEAVRLDPGSPKARVNFGQALLLLGRREEAVVQYREALRLFPGGAPVHFQQGVALYQLGRTQEAIDQFAEAARLDPARTLAHFNLGVLLAEQGDSAGAVLHFRRVLDLDPDSGPTVHAHLGRQFLRTGRPQEAVEEYRAALKLEPDSAALAYPLGRALARCARWEEAEEAFRHAIRLQPQVVHGHCALAHVLASRGQREAVGAEYREAFQLDPHWPRTLGEEAWALATNPDAKRRDGPFAVELAE